MGWFEKIMSSVIPFFIDSTEDTPSKLSAAGNDATEQEKANMSKL